MTWEIRQGDCIEQMAEMDEVSVDAIVTDPPYGLGFMGREWDALPPGDAFAEQALRVLKPGGHLLAFGGTRTYHRLACAIEDAGFEIRDCIAWMYGSGFPKSLDVSKAIDKAAGAEREIVGESSAGAAAAGLYEMGIDGSRDFDLTAPATPEAAQWDGWGTALKPAHEPIVVARKPLIGTVAQNVLEHGTGALNVDACRIDGPKGAPASPSERRGVYGKFNGRDGEDSAERRYAENGSTTFAATPGPRGGDAAGRWPANVALDPEAAAELDAQTGELTSGDWSGHRNQPKTRNAFGDFALQDEKPRPGDSGGASRFFYTAKSSRAERNAGLEGFEMRPARTLSGGEMVAEGRTAVKGKATAQNHHPTVKPIALMRWLVRLVTPPGGVILDPFLGSGSTGCAAVLDGFDFIGIEREPEYVAIAEARISFWAQHVGREVDDVLGLHAASTKAEAAHSEAGQTSLLEAA